jgi:hypothetical protein
MKNLLSIIISTLIITGIFAAIINNRANTKFSRVIKDKEKIIDSLKKNPHVVDRKIIKVEIGKQLKKINLKGIKIRR